MGHTPGPWEEHILQRLTCGCIIMRSTSRAGGAYLVHCDLHAAAPALLAACKAALGAARDDLYAPVSQLEAAIAKAKGDQCPTE